MKRDFFVEKSIFMFVNKHGELEIKTETKYRTKFLNLVGYNDSVFGVLNYIAIKN